jgi:hypothetical protein
MSSARIVPPTSRSNPAASIASPGEQAPSMVASADPAIVKRQRRPSWFDKLTMRVFLEGSFRPLRRLILSLSKDEAMRALSSDTT